MTTDRTLRAFGAVSGSALLALGAAVYTLSGTMIFALGGAALAFFTLAAMRPSSLGLFYAAWLSLLNAATKVFMAATTALLFAVVVTPVGVGRRLAGHQRFRFPFRQRSSLWIEVQRGQ